MIFVAPIKMSFVTHWRRAEWFAKRGSWPHTSELTRPLAWPADHFLCVLRVKSYSNSTSLILFPLSISLNVRADWSIFFFFLINRTRSFCWTVSQNINTWCFNSRNETLYFLIFLPTALVIPCRKIWSSQWSAQARNVGQCWLSIVDCWWSIEAWMTIAGLYWFVILASKSLPNIGRELLSELSRRPFKSITILIMTIKFKT